MSTSLVDTLRAFNASIKANDMRIVWNRMRCYRKKMATFNKDVYQIKINQDEEVQACVRELLRQLAIPRTQWGRFLNVPLNLYELLTELDALTNSKNQYVNQLLLFVQDKEKQKKQNILSVTSFILLLLACALPFLVTTGLTVLQSLFAATLFFPIVGVLYTIGIGIYSCYQSITQPGSSLFQQFRENFFLLASSALNIAAYSVLIAAAATMSPVAAILFVVASSLSIINESIHLIQLWHEYKQYGPPLDTDSLEIRQQKTRMMFEYHRVQKEVAFSLVASVLMAGIVAVWCFVPGGLFVSLGALCAIGVVYGAKSLASTYHRNKVKTELNEAFDAIELKEQMACDYEIREDLCVAIERDTAQSLKAQMTEVHACDDALQNTTKSPCLGSPSSIGLFSKRGMPQSSNQCEVDETLTHVNSTSP